MKQQVKGLLLIALLSVPFTGSAKFPGILKRFQLGYSFVSNKAEYSSAYKVTGVIDTAYKPYEMKTSAAWGFTAGTYFPLKRMGNASSLNLGIDYMYNLMTWKSQVPGEGFNGQFDGVTAQMALPIGLDLKFGSDAVQVRTPRLCGTIGAGAYPSYSLTTVTGAPITIDPTFAVAPYIKAEVGFFAGVCIKARLLYAIGDLAYMDYKSSQNSGGIETNAQVKLIGKSNMAISILIMPFSYKWNTENWWNTY